MTLEDRIKLRIATLEGDYSAVINRSLTSVKINGYVALMQVELKGALREMYALLDLDMPKYPMCEEGKS
jgi:hypothetical protein